MMWPSFYIAAYFYAVSALLGLVMGSFLNCWAWRIVHGESVLHGRSHCTTCGHVLGPADLVPVASWLASRGRCRYCGDKVSWRYPATELVCAAAYVSIVAVYGPTLEALELVCFASVLFLLSLTDIDTYIIPDGTIIAAIAIRALYIVAAGLLVGADMAQLAVNSLVGGLAVGLPLLGIVFIADRIIGRDSMGGGDLKLFFVAGLYFGWQQCLLLVIIACIIGIIVAFAAGKPQAAPDGETDPSQSAMRRVLPFGPSIALACWIIMLCGDQALAWYWGMF